MKAEVTGDKELIAKLDKLKKTKIKSIVNKSSRAGNKQIQKEAKKLAPKRTGLLRKSIKVRALKRSRVRAGTSATLSFKGDGFYGSFVDLGTKHQKAQNFMQRAADNVGKKALDTATKMVADLTEAELKKGAK